MKIEEEVKKYMENKYSMIKASNYQIQAKETAIFPSDKALEYLSLGLVGEAGEVANKIKKLIRDGRVDHDWKNTIMAEDIASEVGDVLWYCAMLTDHIGIDLGKVMEKNLDKLKSRKSRGVLGGSGDNR